ncbi:hypothetical protein ACJ2A9_02285 [Anaerobacillus sp. MEB173]|uniref:hypothetical protein n=1 Tax=Anaerobacillus sp. MEB173 TaxID=3383345 RepID=UPI003F8ED45B
MKKSKIILLLLLSSLSFSNIGLAAPGDSPHGHDDKRVEDSSSNTDVNNDVHGEVGHDMMYMENDVHGEDDHDMMNMDEDVHGEDDHDMMNMDEDGHGDAGHGETIEETPPNYIVLGSFGVINLSFLLYGAWHKWLKRRGNINGKTRA